MRISDWSSDVCSSDRATVALNSWRALVRLAVSGSVGWFRAWMEGEWESPDPVALFELFMVNRISLGEAGRASGPNRLFNRLVRTFQANPRTGARRTITFHYALGKIGRASCRESGCQFG